MRTPASAASLRQSATGYRAIRRENDASVVGPSATTTLPPPPPRRRAKISRRTAVTTTGCVMT